MTSTLNARDLLDLSPVIPVVVVDDAQHAVPMARALAAGGVRVLELTLRTPVALDALRRVAAEVPEVVVGAGTVVTAAQAEQAAAAGAQFLVSPGSTARLRAAARGTGLVLLPGVATVSEVMTLLEDGIDTMKFFPAEASGGATYLAALAGPLPDVRFCPTGGITETTAVDYLRLPTVGCVGGSWLTPSDAMAAGDWARLTTLAERAAALPR
jgi:2-dehydro-3-deoxyphosphogluconate aldolase/(4S)-4-hydroxy-2-oxoglutarate aldolase